MKNLIAKPIVKDQYWVITDGKEKVGNVIAEGSGFNLILNGKRTHYENTNEIKQKARIQFQPIKTNKNKIELPLSFYPHTGKTYNSVLDIKRKLHIYTKTSKSKCFYAAGYYVINQTGQNEVVFCPKYIFIQRYPYIGPFKTEEEAYNMINNL